MAVIEESYPRRVGKSRVGLDRHLDLLGVPVQQRLQVDLDDIAAVPKPATSTLSDEFRMVQAVGNVEETFMGEDKATHPSALHSRSLCQCCQQDVPGEWQQSEIEFVDP
jgi:hypothetical protein